jgi:hypothetical protein
MYNECMQTDRYGNDAHPISITTCTHEAIKHLPTADISNQVTRTMPVRTQEPGKEFHVYFVAMAAFSFVCFGPHEGGKEWE